jgi:hypothetical protein
MNAFRVYLAVRGILSGNLSLANEDHVEILCCHVDMTERSVKRALRQLMELGMIRSDDSINFSILGETAAYRTLRAKCSKKKWGKDSPLFDFKVEVDYDALLDSKQFSAWTFAAEVAYINFKKGGDDHLRPRTPTYCNTFHAVRCGRQESPKKMELPTPKYVDAEGREIPSAYNDLSSSYIANSIGLSKSRARELRSLSAKYGYISSDTVKAVFQFNDTSRWAAGVYDVQYSLLNGEKHPHMKCLRTCVKSHTLEVMCSNRITVSLYYKPCRAKRIGGFFGLEDRPKRSDLDF